MLTVKDFKTTEEQIECIKGILEMSKKIIKGIRADKEFGYLTKAQAEEMIENEKVCTWNLIDDFFEED